MQSVLLHDGDAALRLGIIYDAALERLLRAHVTSEDLMSDYGISQAFRALMLAIHSGTQPMKIEGGVAASATTTTTAALSSSSSSSPTSVRVRGCEAVMHRMCLEAVLKHGSLEVLVYLSQRALTDPATNFGEGNDRPCCTDAWSSAMMQLSSYLTRGDGSVKEDEMVLAHHVRFSPRVQLGFLLLCGSTLRAVVVANMRGHERPSSMFAELSALGRAWLEHIISDVAPLASISSRAGGEDDVVSSSSPQQQQQRRPPTRLQMEANNFIIHSFYWLCCDILVTYSAAESSTTTMRVLDLEVPQLMWPKLSLLKCALVRACTWLEEEVMAMMHVHQDNGADGGVVAERRRDGSEMNVLRPHVSAADVKRAQAMLRMLRREMEIIFSAHMHRQEELLCAQHAAKQRFGDASTDFRALSDVLWAGTLRLALTLQSLCHAWIAVHGGLGMASLTQHVLLHNHVEVLTHIASCLVHVPALESAESPHDVLVATNALMSALITSISSAPLPQMQAQLWQADARLTQQIHSIVAHRALRFRDEQVLRLASSLSSLILSMADGGAHNTNTKNSLVGQFAVDASEQLLAILTESRDGASHCVAPLMMEAIAQRPHMLIPSIMRLLQHSNTHTRRNALDVLAGLPSLRTAADEDDVVADDDDTSSSWRPAVPGAAYREMLRLLAEQLMMHMNDEELCIRLTSASLFAKVMPEDVVLPLVHVFLQRDPTGRRQAGAQDALTAVMRAHTDDVEVVLLLLRVCLDVVQAAATSSPTSAITSSEGTQKMIAARPTPTNPGDVLSYAMLYSTEAMDAHTPPPPSTSASSSSPDAAEAGDAEQRTELKTEKLHRLIDVCCRAWANDIQQWSVAHTTPLMRWLRSPTLEDESSRQWCAKYVSHLCAIISAVECARNPLAEAINTELLQGIQDEDSATATTTPTSSSSSSSYLQQLRTLGTNQEDDGDGGANLHLLFTALLPWLMLRACNSSMMMMDSDDNAVPASLAHVWEVLWLVLLHEDYANFCTRHVEVQRLMLDVATRFSARAFFGQLQQTTTVANAEIPSSPTLLLLRSRMIIFGVCAYISRAQHTLRWQRGDEHVEEEVRAMAVLQHTSSMAPHISEMVETIVVPWLMHDDSSPTKNNNNIVGGDNDENTRKLAISVAEALSLFALSSMPTNTLSSMWSCYESIALTPVKKLSECWRGGTQEGNDDGGKTSRYTTDEQHNNNNNNNDDIFVAEDVLHECDLVKHHYAMQVMQHTLTFIRSQNVPPRMLLLWLQTHLPLLVEVANAACARQQQQQHQEQLRYRVEVAAQSAEILFVATMAAGKLSTSTHPTSTSSASSSASAEMRPLLCELPMDDQHALASFAIGCTRFHASVEVQQSGVKLLSAMVGSAPEMLANLNTGESSTTSSTNNALIQATRALEEVALLHPHAQTRMMAQHVVDLLHKSMDA